MTEQISWLLTDDDQDVWLDEIRLSAGDLGVPGMSVCKRTLRGGRRDGVDIIEVDNGQFTFSVLPTRGMAIWRGAYRGTDVGWQSPARGPVNPLQINLESRGGLGFLEGFDELVTRCGLNSMGAACEDVVPDNMGNPVKVLLPLHGKIGNTPAHYVEVQSNTETGTVKIIGRVQESAIFSPGLRLESIISTTPNSNCIMIEDTVSNVAGTRGEMELLYHCNFGQPFLGEDSRLMVPISEMAPRDLTAAAGVHTADVYRKPTAGFVEQVFFYQLTGDENGNTLSALVNANADMAAVLRFNTGELPCFTQWKNTAAMEDGYVTAMEPATAFPNPKPTERSRNRVINLEPGESYTVHLGVEIYDDADSVRKITDEIAELQLSSEQQIHKEPIARFSEAQG
jgi:hypothetical protein